MKAKNILSVLFRALQKRLIVKYENFVNTDPLVPQVAIERTVMLLRRDFSARQQNEIYLEIGKKLQKMREQDLKELREKCEVIEYETEILNSRVAL